MLPLSSGGSTRTLELMKTTCLTLWLLACAVTVSSAEKSVRRATKHEKAKVQTEEQVAKRQAAKAQAEKLAAKRQALREEVEKTTAIEIEEKNSDQDLLRGKITHSTPAENGEGYTAYVMLEWGDLDHLIAKCGKEYYSNWDGFVKLQEAGKASVVKEFAFDDRNSTTGGRGGRDGLGRDSGKHGARSGRDFLIRDSESSMVAWKAGVVGATDGLLIRLDLKQEETRGKIQVGNFTIPFEITPVP